MYCNLLNFVLSNIFTKTICFKIISMSQYNSINVIETFGDYTIFSKHSLLKGLIHVSGRVILENVFSEINFDTATNSVVTKRDIKRNVICFSIEETITQRYDLDGNKVALLDGKLIRLPSNYESCGDFNCGLAPVQKLIENFTPCAEFGTTDDILGCSRRFCSGPRRNYPCKTILVAPWGYVDEDFHETIPCQYKHAENFADGLALVTGGYINTHGELVIKETFAQARSFCNGYAAVKSKAEESVLVDSIGDYKFSKSVCPWKFIDTTGKVVVSTNGETLFDVHCGMARYIDFNNRYAFIEISTGKTITGIPYAEDFVDGIAKIKLNHRSDTFYNLNLDGDVEFALGDDLILVPFTKIDFTYITISQDGNYILTHKRIGDSLAEHVGILGKNGLFVPAVFQSIRYDSKLECFVVKYDKRGSEEHYISINGKSLILSEGNNEELSTLYWQFEKLSDNLFKVGHSQVGVINYNENVVLPELYHNVQYIEDKQILLAYKDSPLRDEEGLLHYNIEGEQLAFNGSEIIVLKNVYDAVKSFKDERCAVMRDWMWGFVDVNGDEVIPCVYDEVNEFCDGRCVVHGENGIAIIDEEGNVILESKSYSEVSNFSNGKAIVNFWNVPIGHTNRSCVLEPREINRNGEILLKHGDEVQYLDKRYIWYGELNESLLNVYSNGKFGILDADLNEILSCNYDSISYDSSNNRIFLIVDNTFESCKLQITKDLTNFAEHYHVSRFYLTCNDSDAYHIYNSNGEYLFAIECRHCDKEDNKTSLPKGILSVDEYHHGLAIVKKRSSCYNPHFNATKGAIDKDGNYIIAPIYRQLEWDNEFETLIGQLETENYTFNTKGEILVKTDHGIMAVPGYDTCELMENDVLRVSKDGCYGFINSNLEILSQLSDSKSLHFYYKPYYKDGKYLIERRINQLRPYITPQNLINELEADGRIVTYKGDEQIVLPYEYQWAELWIGAYLPVDHGPL